MKKSKYLVIGFLSIWSIYSIWNISRNFKGYSLLSWIIVLTVFITPIYICHLILKRKSIQSSKKSLKRNQLSSQQESSTLHTDIRINDEKTLNKVDTPPPASTEMRQTYTHIQVQNLLRILTDCMTLTKTSNNIDTVISRIEIGAHHAYSLKRLEQLRDFPIQPIADTYLNLFVENKNGIILGALQRSYNDMISKSQELKTPSAREKRKAKYFDNLKQYEHMFNDTIMKYIESLKNGYDFLSDDCVERDSQPIITTNAASSMPVSGMTLHEDLDGLIWIADGPYKNIKEEYEVFTTEFFTYKYNFHNEPSAVYTALPIAVPDDVSMVDDLDYYPTYKALSPEQKWVYLQVLSNPYDSTIEIGYIFILYYGLERHLLKGNFEKAFDVVMKLRGFHQNKSFQTYSADALFMSSVIHRRPDKLAEFAETIVSNDDISTSPFLYVLIKAVIDDGLSASDLINLSTNFGFTNKRYIKGNRDLFEEKLELIMKESFENGKMPIRIYLASPAWQTAFLVFANTSFESREVKVPDMFSIDQFKKAGFGLLQKAHDLVKVELRELRKTHSTA